MEQGPATYKTDAMLSFSLAHTLPSTRGPRLCQLTHIGRKAIKTPHYVATTSRGIVPHISHDTMQKHTSVSSVYLALEDCKEYHYAFTTAFADSVLTVSH